MELDEGLLTPQPPEKISLIERVVAFLEIVLVGIGASLVVAQILFLAGIDQNALLGNLRLLVLYLISEAVLTLVIVVVLLRLRREGWRTLAPQPARLQDLKAGIAVFPLLLLTVLVSGLFFQWFLPDWVTEENPILSLLNDPVDLLLLVISSIFVGGIKEEIQRAFVLVRFDQFLGGSLVGLIFWSVVFGLGHVPQGPDNGVRAALLGLLLGIVYLRRKNPVAPMTAHAIYNIAVVLFTWFYLA